VYDGAILCRPPVKVNIEAQTDIVSCGGSDYTDAVTPVHMQLSGPVRSVRTEFVIPYMIFGDKPKDPDIRGKNLKTGRYVLSAIPGINLGGGMAIRFDVVDCID